jgi:hypothetical protein
VTFAGGRPAAFPAFAASRRGTKAGSQELVIASIPETEFAGFAGYSDPAIHE